MPAYDDEAYSVAWSALIRAIAAMHEAGGTRQNVEDACEAAIEDEFDA